MAHSGKTMTFATDIVPQEDNIYNLGNSSQRWKIYGDVQPYTSRIYPVLGTTGERSAWYKITFPYHNATTGSAAKWFMNSFDLHFGGGYQNNPSGVAHVTFYWNRAANNGAWTLGQGAAHIEGILANKIIFYYRVAEPGILYVCNSANAYNGIWLDNLYVDDTSPSLDWSTTKIETTSAITANTNPALSAYTVLPATYLYNDADTLKTDGNFEGKYIKGTWLYTSAATAKTSTVKLATIESDNFIYYITPANALKSAVGTTAIGGDSTPIYWDGSAFTTGTALSDGAYKSILNNTSKGALGWNSAGNTNANNLRLINVNTLAYWNGAYSGTSSNLSVLGTVTTGTWNASVIGAAYGGTGKTTLKDSANALINALDTGSSDLTANDYVITQYVGGGTTTTTYHRRPANKVINGTLVKAALGTNSTHGNTFLRKDGTWQTPPYPVTSVATLTGAITASDLVTNLGLSKAMNFLGVATVVITDGGTEDPKIGGNATTVKAGDVVIDSSSSREYVWSTTGKWELLGGDSSYWVSSTGTTGQFWRGDNSWSNEISGEILKITANSNTLSIGSQNGSFTHIYNSASIPFIFNNTVLTVSGNLGNTTYPFNNLYIGAKGNRNIYYVGTKVTNAMITFLDNTADAYGNGIKIGGGGVVVIGAGESAANLSVTPNAEALYLTADGTINIEAGGDTIANRVGMQVTTAGHVIPVKAEAAHNNAQNLGASDNKWANVYATTLDGVILKLHQGTAADPSLTGNARIEFDYSAGQPVVISYTPNDSYRDPAGLKIMGGASATPAWLEVEGDVYAAAFKGNADTATSSKVLANQNGTYGTATTTSNRVTDTNIAHVNNGGVTHFKVGTATNGPASGGNILHFYWDTADAWDAQLHMPNNSAYSMSWRASSAAGTWDSWRTLLDANNYSSYALPLSGGTMTGHIFMGGSNASSSTANTTQLVFGTSTTQHIAVTSNDKALILNPSTGSTTNQIVLYLNKKSKFPSGIEGDVTGDLTGNADTATSAGKWTTARTLTIGNKGQSVDGSGNVSWSLADIGAAPAVSGGYLPLSGGTMTGALNTKNSTWNAIGDDSQLGDIDEAGTLGIQGKNGNTAIRFTTYNQTVKKTGGKITWDGEKFDITSTTPINGIITDAVTTTVLHTATLSNTTESDQNARIKAAIKAYFDSNKASIPRDKTISFHINTGNGEQAIGYYISSYDSNPYGGFFVAHYDTPRYVGIQNGSYTCHELVRNNGGSYNINAATATSAGKWTTARTLTIGNKGQSVDGSGNVSWTLADIGAAPAVSGGYLPLSGGDMTGAINLKGADLNLKSSGTGNDAADLVWWYGNGKEQARIWMAAGGDNKWAPLYRCYKSDGTSLYNGHLVLGDGTGASGTWGIAITGKAGSVDWANTGHPSTFPPTIGTTATTAMAGNTNVNNVSQTISSTTDANYRVLLSGTSDDTTRNEGTRKDTDFYYNPSTNLLHVDNLDLKAGFKIRHTTIPVHTWANVEQWWKIAQVTGYFNIDIYITGTWSSCRPTVAVINILNMQGTVKITQKSGYISDVIGTMIKLGKVETNKWDVLIYTEGYTSGSMGQQEYWFYGYGDIVTYQPTTADTTTYSTSSTLALKDISGVTVSTDNSTSGDANGQIKLAGKNISVTGLGSLAYKSSLTYSDVGALASTTKYAASSSVGGAATNATTTANTTDSIYPVGVKSGATTTLLHDTSITMKGGAISATTYTVNSHVTLQYNSTDSSLEFVFA